MQALFLSHEDPLAKEMATHFSILAWTEEPGGLQSTGSQRVGHDWSNLAHTHAYIDLSYTFFSIGLLTFLKQIVGDLQFSQFSHSVVSDSLWLHESQHARPPCPSPTPRVYPNPCPSSWWCHPAISSSVVPFSSCPQSLPASGSFPMSQLSESGG